MQWSVGPGLKIVKFLIRTQLPKDNSPSRNRFGFKQYVFSFMLCKFSPRFVSNIISFETHEQTDWPQSS